MEEFGWFNPGIETCGSSGLMGQNGPTHGPCQVVRALRGLIRTESNSRFSMFFMSTSRDDVVTLRIFQNLSESFRFHRITQK